MKNLTIAQINAALATATSVARVLHFSPSDTAWFRKPLSR